MISFLDGDGVANVTIRNIPDEVHRALRVMAASHGRSTEAEIRCILEAAIRPVERVRLGSALMAIGQEAGALSDAEASAITGLRDNTPAQPLNFE